MALLSCIDCKGKVSSNAAQCPHCGAPVSLTMAVLDQEGASEEGAGEAPSTADLSETFWAQEADSTSQSEAKIEDGHEPADAATSKKTKGSSSNYFVRHWRGELSLAQSFWLNFLLLSWFLAGVSEYWIIASPETFPAEGTALKAFAVANVALVIWQVGGVWSAAEERVLESYDEEGLKASQGKFFARAAQVIIALYLLIAAKVILEVLGLIEP